MVIFRYWPYAAVLLGLYVLQSGWAAILIYHGGLVAALVSNRRDWHRLRWIWRPKSLALGIGAGLLALPAVYFALPLLAETGKLGERLAYSGMGGASLWVFIVYLSTVHAALEELGWRWALDPGTERFHLRDMEFAAYHLLVIHYFFPFAWLLLAAAFVTLAAASWIWRWIYRKEGSLATPIAFHAAGDLGAMLGVAMALGS